MILAQSSSTDVHAEEDGGRHRVQTCQLGWRLESALVAQVQECCRKEGLRPGQFMARALRPGRARTCNPMIRSHILGKQRARIASRDFKRILVGPATSKHILFAPRRTSTAAKKPSHASLLRRDRRLRGTRPERIYRSECQPDRRCG